MESLESRANHNYQPVDDYLTSIIALDLEPRGLAVHLKNQLEGYAHQQNGASLKAITVIRTLIEEKGGDPDALMEQIKNDQPIPENLHTFVTGLFTLVKKSQNDSSDES